MPNSSNAETEQSTLQAHRKLSRDKLEFLPAALEIQAAPPAKWSRSLLWAIILLLLSAVAWACWAEIDIIATAQGKIVPSGKVKVIQPLETGVVKSIYVKEGEQVKAGDKLIALDSTSSKADVDRLYNDWLSYSNDIARLNLFLQHLANSNVEINTTLPTSQQSLLVSSLQEYRLRVDSYLSEIAKLRAEKKATSINVTRLSQTLPLVTEQVESAKSLLSKSLVPRERYLELEKERIDQAQMLNLEKANSEQITASIQAAQQTLAAFRSEVKRNALQEINQLVRQSESVRQELTKAKRLAALRVLTAPVDGIVEQLAVATIGGVVTPAQELMRVVPINSSEKSNKAMQLEIDAGLLNKDIGFVHVGQIAEIKVDSFPFTKYGVIDGEVIDISADAVEHERLGLLFPLKASLQTDQINIDGKWVKLKPGMSVTVEIKTGTRRLMEFLLAPLIRGVSEGARER